MIQTEEDKAIQTVEELMSVEFVKWTGETWKREVAIFPKSQLSKVKRQYRSWNMVTLTKQNCPKCQKPLADWGLVNTIDGIVKVLRCSDDNCDYAETNVVYTPKQVELMKLLDEANKHCGKRMKSTWKYCPYCGEEL